jgi:hypothetical protein
VEFTSPSGCALRHSASETGRHHRGELTANSTTAMGSTCGAIPVILTDNGIRVFAVQVAQPRPLRHDPAHAATRPTKPATWPSNCPDAAAQSPAGRLMPATRRCRAVAAPDSCDSITACRVAGRGERYRAPDEGSSHAASRDLCGRASMHYRRPSRWATNSPVACGCSAVGSAQPCQGWGRGFESRHPLDGADASTPAVEWPSGEATACKAVHTGSIPVSTSEKDPGAISSAGERFPDTEEVTGSIPVSRTTCLCSSSMVSSPTKSLSWAINGQTTHQGL